MPLSPERIAELDQFYSSQNSGQDFLTQLAPDNKTTLSPQRMAELDTYYAQTQPKQPDATQVGIGRTAFDQGMQGATFGLSDEISDRIGAGMASLYTGESYDSLLKEARSASKERMAAEFDQNPGTAIISNLAGGLLTGGAGATTTAGTAVANSLRTGSMAARVGKASLAGAASGAAYGAGTADEGSRLQGAATGALVGAAIPAAIGTGGAALKAGARAVTPTIQEGLLPVVELAQKYNIPVALHQVAEGNAIKNFQKVSKELPFSGEAKFRESQMGAFNKALINTVGGKSSKFTPELMDNLFTRVGKEFDNLGRGKTFNLNDEFLDSVANIASDAEQIATKDAQANFEKAYQKIFANAQEGKISGEKLSQLRSETNRMARKATNPDTKELLHDLENSIVDVMTAGDDAASGALSKAKQQYKNLLILEPLASKAKGGNISPTQLQGRVSKIYGRQFTRGKAGEIGDLARIGNEIMPELGGSDTVQKAIYASGATTAFLNPALAAANAGKAATLFGANRVAQAGLNRNQAVVRAAANKTTKRLTSNTRMLP